MAYLWFADGGSVNPKMHQTLTFAFNVAISCDPLTDGLFSPNLSGV